MITGTEHILIRMTLSKTGERGIQGAHVVKQAWVEGPDGMELRVGTPQPLSTDAVSIQAVLGEVILAYDATRLALEAECERLRAEVAKLGQSVTA